jgi:hypothetical protein
MEKETRIIEVNGVKLEVDLRNAKVIENYKVGDHIKVLKKNYSDYSSYLGVIVGFDNFEQHPTIVIAYLKSDYSSASIEFVYYNSESKEVEIAPVNDYDIPYSKQSIIDKMNAEISKKEEEIKDLQSKKAYFLNMFGKFFENKISSEF